MIQRLTWAFLVLSVGGCQERKAEVQPNPPPSMVDEAKDIVACHQAVDAMEARMERCFGRLPKSMRFACDGNSDGDRAIRGFVKAGSETVSGGTDCQNLKDLYAAVFTGLK